MTEFGESTPGINVKLPSDWKKDLLFFLAASTSIALLAFFLFQDLQNSSKDGLEPIAKLSFRERRVERKIGGEVIWSGIGVSGEIYNYDSIRTEEDSQARISLDGDTELVLLGSSLVMIIMDQEKLSVNLDKGKLSVISTPVDFPLEVKSASGTLKIEGGGSASIVKGETGLQVDVLDGEAIFEGNNGQMSLSKNQNLLQGLDGQIRVQEIPFQVVSPYPLQLLFSDTALVQFEWISKQFEAQNIEIAKTKDFDQSLQVFDVHQPGAFQAELTEGTWFWRVSNSQEKSPITMFGMVRDHKPDPLAPVDNHEFTFFDKPPLVRLQWQKSDNAMFYNVRVFRTEDMEQPIQNITVQNSSIFIDNLEEGQYLWEIEGVFSAFQKTVTGTRSNFRIVNLQVQELSEPKIHLDPEISQYSLERAETIITWEGVPGLDSYLTEVFQGDVVLLEQEIRGTYLELPKDLAQGEYKLRITALSDGKALTSQSREFVVKKFGSIDFLLPQNNARYFDTTPRIGFRWWDANKGNSYLLEIARDVDFRQGVVSQRTEASFLSIKNLDLGNYYSRVNLLDENGNQLTSSSISSFTVERWLEKAPAFLGPTTIDLTVYGSLNLAWSSIEQADFYRLAITSEKFPTAARTWDVQTPYKQETDVFSLPLGSYYYSLTAFSQINGEEIPISETNNGYFELQRTLVRPATQIEIF